MTSAERIKRAIRGEPVDRTPIYGWVSANLSEEIKARYGSVAAFEDKYEFDAAHIFGAPEPHKSKAYLRELQARYEELTPDILLDEAFFFPAGEQNWERMERAIAHHKRRDRFCYVQTPGFFEYFNSVFGLENHLMYLLIYRDEIAELYRRQADWLIEYVDRCLEREVDCIHLSDDWGSQRALMFSPE